MQDPDALSVHDPVEQLARLERLCRLRSIAVYRETALYLQILREELEPSLRQSLFQLISETDPLRFSRMPELRRQRFHSAIRRLTQRCSVLLTVEQQMLLAEQIQKEHARRQAMASRQVLENLQQVADVPPDDKPTDAAGAPGIQRGRASIELSLRPPLDHPQRYGYKPVEPDPPAQSPGPSQKPAEGGDPNEIEAREPESDDLSVLRSLFELAGDALQHQRSAQSPASSNQAGVPEGTRSSLLPTMPDALLAWMQGMDSALSRRLRNLSHAVNVQMLRIGLSQALLPVNLLEAVIAGQLETQASASNLIRLRLPLAMGDLEPGMDVLCVLLRASELEFDSHRLRRCRQRLREQQRELLTMVRQQRHWERRCLDREARKPWQTPPDPSSTTPAG